MRSRSLLALVLLAAILPLTSMAYASPPDPLWTGGWWDDDDYDNVVDLITAGRGVVQATYVLDIRPSPLPLVAVPHPVQPHRSNPALALSAGRAPPSS